MYVHIYIYIYIYMCVCVCVYIYIYNHMCDLLVTLRGSMQQRMFLSVGKHLEESACA